MTPPACPPPVASLSFSNAPTGHWPGRPWTSKIGLLVLLTGLLAADVQAQDDPGEERTSGPPRGAWALQFQIGQDFTLQPFQGATVSAKKSLSATRAFRFGTTLEANVLSADDDFGEDQRSNNQQVSATAQYLFYTAGEAEQVGTVRFYSGVGPQARLARSAATNEPADGEERKRTAASWDVGILGDARRGVDGTPPDRAASGVRVRNRLPQAVADRKFSPTSRTQNGA